MSDQSKKHRNELFLTHKGVEVYHTYVRDTPWRGRSRYIYTTDPFGVVGEEPKGFGQMVDVWPDPPGFDVRALERAVRAMIDPHDHEGLVRAAIDQGLIKPHLG